jgi:hypothetical protein
LYALQIKFGHFVCHTVVYKLLLNNSAYQCKFGLRNPYFSINNEFYIVLITEFEHVRCLTIDEKKIIKNGCRKYQHLCVSTVSSPFWYVNGTNLVLLF